jgi:phospholipid-transporting ATPase
MMNFVAISLLVSLEMVKFTQGLFIEYDYLMYDEEKDMSAKAKSSNLNEELGMVKYIFSDKTGTLTKNIMEYKKFSAGNKSYGISYTNEDVVYEEGVTNVNFYDSKFEEDWEADKYKEDSYLNKFINILAICHTIIVQVKDDKLVYNASSPDELALTNAARHFGIVFEERDAENRIVIHNKL